MRAELDLAIDERKERVILAHADVGARMERRAALADDDAARGEGMDFTLRFAMLHMIEETARHCGHLDLLREATDGVVGM